MSQNRLLVTIISFILLISCEEKSELNLPLTITTLNAEFISDTVVLSAQVNGIENLEEVQFGFVLTNKDTQFTDTLYSQKIEGNSYSLNLLDRYAQQGYEYKAFVKKNLKYYEANSRQFVRNKYIWLDIYKISPNFGMVGDEIDLYCSNLEYFKGQSLKVYFNEISVDIKIVTKKYIRVRVPKFDYIKDVRVCVKYGNELFVADDRFKPLGPRIVDFYPKTIINHDTVTIVGDGFDPIKERNVIKINNIKQKIVSLSGENMKIVVDKASLFPNSYPLRLEVGDFKTESESNIEIATKWKRLDDFPNSQGVAHSNTYSIGEYIYTAVGSYNYYKSSARYKDVYKYNTITNKWETAISFPGSNKVNTTGFVHNNSGYILSGETLEYNNVVNDFWKMSKDKWIQLSSPSCPERVDGVAIPFGDKIYYGFGTVSGWVPYKDFWSYDPVTEVWQKLAQFPDAARENFIFLTKGNKIYIVGGASKQTYTVFNDVWEYDIDNNTWLKTAQKNFSFSKFVSVGERIFVLKEFSNIANQGGCYKLFELNTSTWKLGEMLDVFPGTYIQRGAYLEYCNGKIYYGGGELDNGTCSREFWSYPVPDIE
jgi:hypothetical protein